MSDALDPLTQYLASIAHWPILTRAQERTADPETLVNHNLRLVVSISKKYLGRGTEMMDLIQEGNIGLMRAAVKFKPELGNKFSTMAVPWIMQGIERSLHDKGRMIRLPVHVTDSIRRLNKAREQIGYDATPDRIAGTLGWSVDKTNRVMHAVMNVPFSLEAVLVSGHDSKERTLADFIPAPAIDYDQRVVGTELAAALDDAMQMLDERERAILWLRYRDGCTLDQAGIEYNVTRERARQIESGALRKLREATTSTGLRVFLEG